MRRRGGPDPSPLSGILGAALPRGAEGRLALPEIRSAWPEIVGKALAERTFAEDLRDGVLAIRADGPASAQMASMRGGSIASELSRRFGVPVESVRVTTGRIQRPRPARRTASAAPRVRPPAEEVERNYAEIRRKFPEGCEAAARRLASLMAVYGRRFPRA